MNALDDQESDYDVFAAVRPKRLQQPAQKQPEEEEESNDFDPFEAVRPKPEKIREFKQAKQAQAKKDRQPATLKETAIDVAKQVPKELAVGATSLAGDITSLITSKEQTPNQEAKNFRDFDTLQRMNEPGYEPSWADITSLEDDSMLPKVSRGPTRTELRESIESAGGPGEAKTSVGEGAGRAANLFGSGLVPFGFVNPIPAVVGGIAGQLAKELGGGPITQAVAEIIAMLLTPAGGLKKIATAEKEALRDLGYSEEAITLAANQASKGKKFNVKALKSEKTEQAFADAIEHSENAVSDILTQGIPGIEKGIEHVHELASKKYGEFVKESADLVIKDSKPFLTSIKSVIKDLRKNLGESPEAAAFINRLEKAAAAAKKNATAEHFIEFYKELNKTGNWMTRSHKDRLITEVKNGIKDTLKAQGPKGQKLADKFDQVNTGVRKAFQAQDVHELIQKTVTQEGTNFKKLYSLFDKPDNVQLFNQVLGHKATSNLQLIAKTGRDIKNFDKAYKGASLITGTPTSFLSGATYLLYSGNWPALAALKIGEAGARKLAELSLTNPRFQDLYLRSLHAIKAESPKLFNSANEAMQKFLKEEGINLESSQKDQRKSTK